MSKMGISVISSYRGGLNFEAVGLSRAMVAEFFPGMISRISGIGVSGIQKKVVDVHARGWRAGRRFCRSAVSTRRAGRARTHAWEAQTMHMLQMACNKASYELWKQYSAKLRANPPIHLRDLLDIKPLGAPVPIEEVESITSIRKRFVTPGMSLGALSPEAHKTLNVAMNRIGAKSDSGEGGEDPAHFVPEPNGDNPSAKIKQVASGRFGVTAEYLNHCEELEIKVAQGAKPGEGGQLPGMKVTELIARLRHSTKGVTLISPAAASRHLLHRGPGAADLRPQADQPARQGDGEAGGVLRRRHHRRGRGQGEGRRDPDLGPQRRHRRLPQTSIKYAGLPWEMGLTEAHQVLAMNNLRDRVTLRTDGGLAPGATSSWPR
jgi:glutamate synthase (NADPH/NADH) large chain